MSNEIINAAKVAYPTQPIVDGKGPSVPKEAVLDLFAVVQSQYDTLDGKAEAAADGYVIGTTWTALAATAGSRAGQPGRVPTTDTGTHTDPVVGGTVPNSGEFAWSVSPAGWRRVGDVIDSASLIGAIATKAEQAQVDYLAGDGLLNDVYGDAITDAANNVKIGFRFDGTVDVLDSYPLMDTEFCWAMVNDAGQLLYGWRHDGSFYPNTISTTVVNFAFIRDDQVIVSRNGDRAQITYSGYHADANVAGNFATYVEDDGATVSLKTEDILASSSFAPSVTTVLHYLLYGQSLSLGNNTGGALHTAAVRTGRAGMYNIGVRTFGSASPDATVNPENLYAWTDLLESDLESPGSGLGWAATAVGRLPSTSAALVSASGRGGQTYNSLKKGSPYWANMMEAVRRARVMAALNHRDYDVRAVSWIAGQADRSVGQATYEGYMLALQSDLTTDINALTGKSSQVLVASSQMSDWTAYGDTDPSAVPRAVLSVALANPTKIICVGPEYMLPTVSDGIHLTPASSARLGCYHGRAIEQHKGGTPWLPLHCTGATRSGAVVTLHMNVPVGALVIDTTAVSNPGNNGLIWSQTGGTARTIANVAVSGSDIIVTLSGDPGAPSASSIGIASQSQSGLPANGGPTTGPRSNFRDSATDLDIDGNAMPNWACHQLINL